MLGLPSLIYFASVGQSVQSLSRVRLFAIPWTEAFQSKGKLGYLLSFKSLVQGGSFTEGQGKSWLALDKVHDKIVWIGRYRN